MTSKDISRVKDQIRSGSIASLRKYIEEELLVESLRKLKSTKEDHRFHQSRVVALEEILKLLPKSPM